MCLKKLGTTLILHYACSHGCTLDPLGRGGAGRVVVGTESGEPEWHRFVKIKL